MTEHERRCEAAIQEMKDAGLWDRGRGKTYELLAPVREWLLRHLPPSHYMPFGYLFFIVCIPGGALWGTGMYLTKVYVFGHDVQFQSFIFPAFFFGVFLGLGLSIVTLYERKRHNLSRWKDL